MTNYNEVLVSTDNIRTEIWQFKNQVKEQFIQNSNHDEITLAQTIFINGEIVGIEMVLEKINAIENRYRNVYTNTKDGE